MYGYPEPLSAQRLFKKYQETGLSEEKSDFLRKFFPASAKLYGVIRIGEMFSLYKTIAKRQPAPRLYKKDFTAFAETARRDGSAVYYVFLPSEIPETGNTEDMLLVLKELLTDGPGRFSAVMRILDIRYGKKPYLPENFPECSDFETAEGKEFRQYLSGLLVRRTEYRDPFGRVFPCGETGKRLGEIVFVHPDEQFEMDYYGGLLQNGPRKNEKRLEKRKAAAMKIESDKIYEAFLERASTGWLHMTENLGNLFRMLSEVGVEFSPSEAEECIRLATNARNGSHLFSWFGWTPIAYPFESGNK